LAVVGHLCRGGKRGLPGLFQLFHRYGFPVGADGWLIGAAVVQMRLVCDGGRAIFGFQVLSSSRFFTGLQQLYGGDRLQ